MKIKRGHTRIVLLVPLLGIVVKFPRINPLKGLKALLMEPITHRSLIIYLEMFYRELIQWDSETLETFRYYWFRGTMSNWREFWFYLTTRHPLLQPTYFSFFGLFNIQKIGQVKLKKDTENQFCPITAGKAKGHHFMNPENFCLDNGYLKFLDYGNKGTQKIILVAGDQLLQFDPNWDYEEYKKRRTQKPSSANQSDA